MDRRLYPANWDEIAREVKDAANWQCENCGRPCRRPGESAYDLYLRIADEHVRWASDLEDEDDDGEILLKVGRFTLTVAHLDHRPENCDRSNLRALCSVCHCRYDLAAMPQKKRIKAERLGQLTLGV